MATRIAWLLNLEAPDEVADPTGRVPARLDPARVREVMALFFDLVAPEDEILDEPALQGAVASNGPISAVQAFWPTPSALARIAALGLQPPPAPAFSVLRRVEDRAFCAELGHTLPGAAFARDMPALRACLAQPSFTGTHVIKRAFSFAGREQRRVRDGVLDDSTLGFCERSFERGEGVQVEPWVMRLADFSLHGYLTRGGTLLTGEPRQQRCDPMGRFLGMQGDAPDLGTEEAQSLRDEAARTGAALRAAGYFGPFGIDAFRYTGPGAAPAWNPRCEINARFTMGYPRELLLRGLAAE